MKDTLILAYPTKISAIFTRSGYFRLLPGGVKTTSCMTSGRDRKCTCFSVNLTHNAYLSFKTIVEGRVCKTKKIYNDCSM